MGRIHNRWNWGTRICFAESQCVLTRIFISYAAIRMRRSGLQYSYREPYKKLKGTGTRCKSQCINDLKGLNFSALDLKVISRLVRVNYEKRIFYFGLFASESAKGWSCRSAR